MGLAGLGLGRAAPVGGIPKARGRLWRTRCLCSSRASATGASSESGTNQRPLLARQGPLETPSFTGGTAPLVLGGCVVRRARGSTWLQRQSEPQSERFSIRPVWRAQAVLHCELFGGRSRYEHDKYAHRRSQPPILPGRSSRCPATKGDVYPGYGPLFTFTAYRRNSTQSLPGSRSSMITVPSRQPTRLNVASTLIW